MKAFVYSLLILTSLTVSKFSHAELKTFVRDYTYNASENDSKVTARKAALVQLQTLLIQEVGVQVRSSFVVNDEVTNDVLTRDVTAHYGTYAKALTKSIILKERWNGEEFYLKAEITVDTDQIGEQLIRLSQPPQVANTCDSLANEVDYLIERSHRIENVNSLFELAQKHPIDEECYGWQMRIIYQMRSLDHHDDAYRAYLFEQLEKERSSFAPDLASDVLSYTLAGKALSPEEWALIKGVYHRFEGDEIRDLIKLLVNFTQAPLNPNWIKSTVDRNARKQTTQDLVVKLRELTELNRIGQLSSVEPVSQSQLSVYTLNALLTQHQPRQDLISILFDELEANLDADGYRKIAQPIGLYFQKELSEERFQTYQHFMSGLTQAFLENAALYQNDRRLMKSLYYAISKLEQKKEDPRLSGYQDVLINDHKVLYSVVIDKARMNQKAKDLYFIRFDLPNSSVCTPKECADMLFEEAERTQLDGAQYLRAYEKRAKPVEAKVIKKLKRVKAFTRFEEPRYLTEALINVLDSIGSDSKDAYELMIWGVSGKTQQVQQASQSALIKAGYETFPLIKASFYEFDSTTQRRLIEVIGKFKTNSKDVAAFLNTIEPKTERMRFAIEDALEQISTVSG